MIRTFITLLTAALLLAGCSRPSYINVPNDGGDVAINGPNWQTTIQIEKAALRYLLSESPIPGDIVVILPEGTTPATSFKVAAALSDFNVYPEGETPGEEFQVVEVREISARGSRARVDIIRPGSLRQREFVEVYLTWGAFSGWEAERLQVRNFGVERLDPHLLTAPPKKPAKPRYEEIPPPEDRNDVVESED